MATELDQLIAELKRLRQKRGLTLEALSSCTTVLEAFGRPALEEAAAALRSAVADLGEDEPALALRAALAIDMAAPGTLTSRRADLSAKTGRNVKTLAGYEDTMIRELASRLLGREKREVSESHVFVIGYMVGNRLSRVSVTVRFPAVTPGGDDFERTVEYENHGPAVSFPGLIYQLPPTWHPQTLTLGLNAEDGDAEYEYWGAATTDLLAIMFLTEGRRIECSGDTAGFTVEQPDPGPMYTLIRIAT